MAKLEEITVGSKVQGVIPNSLVTIVSINWPGESVLEITYKDDSGRLANELLFRNRENDLKIINPGRTWSFEADGSHFRLVSEAYRISLAHLFDPLLAVHTSLIDPLPHQITAVYGEMLKRQPLRYLLADDPGAGKTIMTGLLIKELAIRGALSRCLIVCPGMLAEQWQDELDKKFQLPFDILTNDKIETSRTGNWLNENNLIICRLDKLSRDEELQKKLRLTDWDLIVCDEAHKMSASRYGSEIKETKRYKLGKLLSSITRHFLLLTATPHNGKEEDFQLFLALLDGDRFEGSFRDSVHTENASDLMRRMIKENLLKFDGTPLFPQRLASTVKYKLSDLEAKLYEQVTNYVREEFNRADALENEGRKGTVGFALTILQRRLASSPEAIYQSLRRRRERFESRLKEEELLKRGANVKFDASYDLKPLTDDDIDDLEDAPEDEQVEIEEKVVDQATAAQTIAELKEEIIILKQLESLALMVKNSGKDKKWEELSLLLHDNPEIINAQGVRKKLVIFTEHRDTLNYLREKITNAIGKKESVVTIHGGIGRDERRKMQESFSFNKDTFVLIATDAAGEGINLQRAHLMINYDLPWNPNRLEQRFGRIHRIGQTEVCHLWNLVAEETRESDVFLRLFEKIQSETIALGGAVFDVLGKTMAGAELRQLLIEAIRYGNQASVRNKLFQKVDEAFSTQRLKDLIEEHALVKNVLDPSQIKEIKENMDRAEARKLQPHFISSFFLKAFEELGGSIKKREPGRYEITHVPASIRNNDRVIGTSAPVVSKYERVTFDKNRVNLPDKPLAAFICPGHALLDSTISVIQMKYANLLKLGTIMIDPVDYSQEPRLLFYLEHSIQNVCYNRDGSRRIISRQIHFVEINHKDEISNAGYAPYLDYRPIENDELELVKDILDSEWLTKDLEPKIMSYAVTEIIPKHFNEVNEYHSCFIDKTIAAVEARLKEEINYWDSRAWELKHKEEAGKTPKVNWMKAKERTEELESRLQKRRDELKSEKTLSPLTPNLIGGALVIPIGYLESKLNKPLIDHSLFAKNTKDIEMIAMETVIQNEIKLGFSPKDVSAIRCGYDIESNDTTNNKLRFIEVKGRVKGSTTITVTKNEILTCLNKQDQYILAIVEIDENTTNLSYLNFPFKTEPDFGATSVNYEIKELLKLQKDLVFNI